jgi:hypothetical protein
VPRRCACLAALRVFGWLALFALYRFKTHRMVFELGIHEISYAAW